MGPIIHIGNEVILAAGIVEGLLWKLSLHALHCIHVGIAVVLHRTTIVRWLRLKLALHSAAHFWRTIVLISTIVVLGLRYELALHALRHWGTMIVEHNFIQL